MPKLPDFVFEEDRLRVQKLAQHATARHSPIQKKHHVISTSASSLSSNACLNVCSSANRSDAATGLAASVPKPRKQPVGQVFGRPLVGMPCFKQSGQIPKVLDKLADYLAQQRCSRTEGIFRVPAQQDMLQNYRAIIDKGGMPDFLTNGDPPVVLCAVSTIGRW